MAYAFITRSQRGYQEEKQPADGNQSVLRAAVGPRTGIMEVIRRGRGAVARDCRVGLSTFDRVCTAVRSRRQR